MSGKNIGDLLNAEGITWGWFYGDFTTDPRRTEPPPAPASTTAITIRSSTTNQPPIRIICRRLDGMIGQTDQANHQYSLTDLWNASGRGQSSGGYLY